ncbi:Der1-like family-domain-containing protein [Cercophora newfieldiana]|uniref:Derlin n=1 Tax=Cercophora newfieldiana TaxID=92897 RepID=A0AA39YK06_9PEZI|nr:Der1-like family-domain-containing protein [Cercophora newfieldiana]
MSEIMDMYWAAKPMARTLATAIVLISLSVYYGSGMFSFLPGYKHVFFTPALLFRFPPQIWRLVTSFLVSGPKLGLIMHPVFAYQYLSQLEAGHPKFQRKEDVLWYLITVGTFIILLNVFYFGSYDFLPGLIIAMCYTVSQDQRGQKTNFLFFTVPAQAAPYCMLIWSLLVGGPLLCEISGIIAAHLHDFLFRLWPEFGGGPNLLATPAWVSYLIQTPRFLQRDYGTAIQPPSRAGAGSTSGRSTGASTGSVLPDSWKTRGSGHRLG